MPPIKKKTPIKGNLPKYLILFGIVLAIIAIFVFKNQKVDPQLSTSETAEQQLDRYLASGKPVFAFIHSTNCQSCIEMMQTVDVVYPEYKDQIAIVDVDVYDPINETLLQRAGVSYIPTQIFIDSTGEGKIAIGAMTPDDLRKSLNELKERKQ